MAWTIDDCALGVEYPPHVEGAEIERKAAYTMAARYLKNRVAIFTTLPLGRLGHIVLRKDLRDIDQLEAATPAVKGDPSVDR